MAELLGSVVKTRPATPDDAPAIYEAHASNAGSMPWDDAGECRQHVEWMIGLDDPPIVAELGRTAIAEMEVWWGQDVPELGRSLDVSMIEVHSDHQRRGAGSGLIEYAFAMAAREKCDCLSVWTDADAVGFYQKHGLEERLVLKTFSVDTHWADAQEAPGFRPVAMADIPRPEGSWLQTGRLVHPRQRWHNFARDEARPPAWKGSDQRRQVIFCRAIDLPGSRQPAVAVYRLAHWRGDAEQAELYLWSPRRQRSALLAAIAHARGIGIARLRILAYGQVAGWLAELGEANGDEEKILARTVG